jgi:hypothetical protein
MRSHDFEYRWTWAQGEPAPVGARVDVVLQELSVGSFPRDLLGHVGEILMTVTLVTGAVTRSWSSMRRAYRSGEVAFDPQTMPYFVADDVPLDRRGVTLAVELREVDDVDALKKVVQVAGAATALAGVVPRVGAAVGTVANAAGTLIGLLPEELGSTFFSIAQNFNVAGGADYHPGLPVWSRGEVLVESRPKPAGPLRGSRVRLLVR